MSNSPARRRVRFPGISSRAWEHPADRSALVALRALPGFDTLLKTMDGLFRGRKQRLMFLASAVRVGERQFPELDRLLTDAVLTLDAQERPELYVLQSPEVNAVSIGMQQPFIVLTTGLLDLMEHEELRVVIGHELGHVLSGHAVYQTMLGHLLRVAGNFGWLPVGGWSLRALIAALYEWSRKSELSGDRAGLLVSQDPHASIRVMMKIAGGAGLAQMDTVAFMEQAAEYESTGDARDSLAKLMNVELQTHPFSVMRAGQIRSWVDHGEYKAILSGKYPLRVDDPQASVTDQVKAAARSYRDNLTTSKDPLTQKVVGATRNLGGAAQNAGQNVASALATLWRQANQGGTDIDGSADEGPAGAPRP
jgi:Zn-dependent protease with chaperone function